MPPLLQGNLFVKKQTKILRIFPVSPALFHFRGLALAARMNHAVFAIRPSCSRACLALEARVSAARMRRINYNPPAPRPEAAEKSQRPDFRHSRQRQVVFGKT